MKSIGDIIESLQEVWDIKDSASEYPCRCDRVEEGCQHCSISIRADNVFNTIIKKLEENSCAAFGAVVDVRNYLADHRKGRMSYRPELRAHLMAERLDKIIPLISLIQEDEHDQTKKSRS